jgi:hypothetical protein
MDSKTTSKWINLNDRFALMADIGQGFGISGKRTL